MLLLATGEPAGAPRADLRYQVVPDFFNLMGPVVVIIDLNTAKDMG